MVISLIKILPSDAQASLLENVNKLYMSTKDTGLNLRHLVKLSVALDSNLIRGALPIVKSMVSMHKKVKSMIGDNDTFELVLTNPELDQDNESANLSLIQKLYSNGLIEKYGDVDHETYCRTAGLMSKRSQYTQDEGTDCLYLLDSYRMVGDNLVLSVKLNDNHKLCSKYKSLNNTGRYLKASAEFNDPIIINGEIIDASSIGWTITENPILESAIAI